MKPRYDTFEQSDAGSIFTLIDGSQLPLSAHRCRINLSLKIIQNGVKFHIAFSEAITGTFQS